MLQLYIHRGAAPKRPKKPKKPPRRKKKKAKKEKKAKVHVLKVGDKVVAKYPPHRPRGPNGDFAWFAATITKIDLAKRRCSCKYEDGDKSADVREEEVRYAPDRPKKWGKGALRGNDKLPDGAVPVVFEAPEAKKAGKKAAKRFNGRRLEVSNAVKGNGLYVEDGRFNGKARYVHETDEKQEILWIKIGGTAWHITTNRKQPKGGGWTYDCAHGGGMSPAETGWKVEKGGRKPKVVYKKAAEQQKAKKKKKAKKKQAPRKKKQANAYADHVNRDALAKELIKTLGNDACQCPACGMVILKAGGDNKHVLARFFSSKNEICCRANKELNC